MYVNNSLPKRLSNHIISPKFNQPHRAESIYVPQRFRSGDYVINTEKTFRNVYIHERVMGDLCLFAEFWFVFVQSMSVCALKMRSLPDPIRSVSNSMVRIRNFCLRNNNFTKTLYFCCEYRFLTMPWRRNYFNWKNSIKLKLLVNDQ